MVFIPGAGFKGFPWLQGIQLTSSAKGVDPSVVDEYASEAVTGQARTSTVGGSGQGAKRSVTRSTGTAAPA
jgi:hypothetical protein